MLSPTINVGFVIVETLSAILDIRFRDAVAHFDVKNIDGKKF